MVLDCLGDRYMPALAVSDPDGYEQRLAEAARRYAAACEKAGWAGWVEFWNEPYLNWAYKPGVNYDGKFYEPKGRAEGKPMTLRGRDKPVEHLVWTKAVRSVHAEDGSTDLMAYLAYNYIGRHNPAGHAFEFRGRKYRNEELWWGRDPTQISYFSGQQNLKWYLAMLKAYAPVLKKARPQVTLAAGWGYHVNASGYRAWDTLYKPTIDAGWQWIDAITEHHYHTDPRRISADYELVTAYAKVTYDKWIRNFNTETQGRTDPNIPGHDQVSSKRDDPLAVAVGSFGYGTRDILCQLAHQPDKAVTRTSHGPDKAGWGLGGDEFVFRLLKPLRGKLVKADSQDPDVWTVASVNGDTLAVALFNDHREQRDVHLSGLGELADGAPTAAWVEVDTQAGKLKLVSGKRKIAADGSLTVALPARSALRLTVPLKKGAKLGRVLRTQYFSPDVKLQMNPDEIVSQWVVVDRPRDPKITQAWVRLALPGDHPGAKVRVNDGPWIELANRPGIQTFPVETDQLADRVKISIQAGREKADAFFVLATSVVVDRQSEN